MASSKPTMQDVADAAGVSLMAVSYALRNHPTIARKTAERIQRIAKELGYVKNPLVAALMSQVRGKKPATDRPVIAYLSSYADRRYMFSNPFRRAYFEGAAQRCEQLGYQLELFLEPDRSQRAGERLTEILKYRNIQGIICGISPVLYGEQPSSGLAVPIIWRDFSSCVIGYSKAYPQLHHIDTNYSRMIILALDRLRELGYRKPGFICGSFENERLEGAALSGLASYNHRLAPKARVPAVLLSPKHWNSTFIQKWVLRNQLDCLVIQHNDLVHLLRKSSLKIPQVLAIATLEKMDDGEDSEVAGINLLPNEVGSTAVEVVIEQLRENRRGIPPIRRAILLDGEWVDGKTAPNRQGKP